MPRKDARHIPFIYITRILTTLIEAEERGEPPLPISELVFRAKVPQTTFYYSIRRQLEELGLVKYVYTRERIIEVHLTEEGRRLAQCLRKCNDVLKKIGVL